MRSARNARRLLLPCLLAAACADPAADYDEYRARTEDIRGKRAGQGGGGGASQSGCTSERARALPGAAPTGDLSGTVLLTCLANVSSCTVDKALRFKADVKQSGAALELTIVALAPGARTAAAVQPDAKPFKVAVTLGADGAIASEPFGDAPVPGPSNAATGHPLQLKGARFAGYQLDANLACAELDGDIVAEVGGTPQPISLNSPGDVCLIERVATPTELHDPPLSAFHCP